MIPIRPVLLFSWTSVALHADEPAAGSMFYHTSWPEASAVSVVGSPPRWLAVVDNELPRVALFPLEPQATKLHAPALAAVTSPAYAVDDLEASTVFAWDPDGNGKPEGLYHVFAASCARTKKGKVVAERDALFALRIDETAARAGKAGAFPAADAVEYNRSLRSQMRALGSENPDQSWGPILRDSVGAMGQEADAQNAALAGAAGLNLEGLTVSKDSRAFFLGLRSPLAEGKALLVTLTNPVAALGLGESSPQPAALSAPLMLDLGGLGFRSIEWDAARGVYLIIAGSADERSVFRCYTWTGEPGAAPVPVNSASAAKASSIDPEGVTPVPGYTAAAVVCDGVAGAPYHKGMWVEFGGASRD
jgi:hypothetical protein